MSKKHGEERGKKRGGKLLLVGCLAIAVMILAGTAGLIYWGQRKAADKVGEEIAFQFRDHPLVRKHVGPSASFVVDSLEFDSDQEAATIILLLSGSAGEGEMVARIRKGDGSGDGEGFDVIEAKLNVPGQAPLSLLPGSGN